LILVHSRVPNQRTKLRPLIKLTRLMLQPTPQTVLTTINHLLNQQARLH
jgi:hypothetical protein